MPKKLQGIVTPLLTPFSADGERIDLGAYRALIDHVIAGGVHAIISNAATSEFASLDVAERMELAATAIAHARGRVPVLIGADGLLLTPTFYGRPTIDAVVRHYAAVSDAVDTPVMLYNAPYAYQVLLTPVDIIRIADRANIPWVKLTTGPSNMIPEHAVELWRLTCISPSTSCAPPQTRKASSERERSQVGTPISSPKSSIINCANPDSVPWPDARVVSLARHAPR